VVRLFPATVFVPSPVFFAANRMANKATRRGIIESKLSNDFPPHERNGNIKPQAFAD